MVVTIDPLLCMILSGVMFFCSGFASYGCYRCFTDIEGTKIVPEGQNLGLYKESRDRYRLKLFRRRPSTASSQATIYSVHSSEIWGGSAKNIPRGPFLRSPSPSGILRNNPTMFVNPSQVRGWTIKEEPEPEEVNDRRRSAPL